jgi:RNA polymerase sigma-70 factor, ECF subfamily
LSLHRIGGTLATVRTRRRANQNHLERSGVEQMRAKAPGTRQVVRNEAISEVSDADLVVKALAGDASAFGHLVHRHAPIAKRMARLWGAGADADDVVQDAFVKAHAALGRFRSTGGFRPWLLSIVHNETRNLHRGRGRRAARESLAQLPNDLWTTDPEEEAIIVDRRRRLLATIRDLPVELREVVACRYLLELTEAETAVTLKEPAGTVKSRLHRALNTLRTEVSHD